MENTKNIFEIAAEKKLRFPFKGNITAEDLYDLSPAELDTVYRALNTKKKKTDEESLLATASAEDAILNTKIAIVKHVFDAKKEAAVKREQAVKNKQDRQRIMDILAARDDEKLQGKTDEELRAMLASLEENPDA